MAEKNYVVYLGENHPELESYSIFSMMNKLGKEDVYLLELCACDVAVEPSYVKFLSHPSGKDENHPAYKVRKPLFDKKRLFYKNGTNPSVVFVMPNRFEDLLPCFRDHPLWGALFEYGYKFEQEVLKESIAMRSAGRQENEILNQITQSVNKIEEEFGHRMKKYLEISGSGQSGIKNVTPQPPATVPPQY